MANPNFYTRIQLKYDTWTNWTKEAALAKVPLKGEVCLVEVPGTGTSNLSHKDATSVTKPAVLMKVGDGVTTFGELPWLSAKAADVHEWAKQDVAAFKTWLDKSVDEGGAGFATDAELANAIQGLRSELETDTNTQYQIVKDSDNYTYKLQSKEKGSNDWADVSGSTIEDTDTQYTIEKVKSDEDKWELKYKTVVEEEYKSFEPPVYIDMTGTISEINSKLSTIENNYIKSVVLGDDGLSLTVTPNTGAAQTYTIQDTTYGIATKDDLGLVLSDEATNGNVSVDSTTGVMTVNGYNALSQTVASQGSSIGGLNTKVTALIDNDYVDTEKTTPKSVRTIAREELVAQLIPEQANEALDTLQEIATWIQNHPEDAAAMNKAIEGLDSAVFTTTTGEDDQVVKKDNIAANTTAIAEHSNAITTLQEKVDVNKVSTSISAAVDALANGQVATNTAGIATINGKLGDGFSDEEGNTVAEKINAVDAALGSYKTEVSTNYATKAELSPVATAQAANTAKLVGLTETTVAEEITAKVNALANGQVATNTQAISTEASRADAAEKALGTRIDKLTLDQIKPNTETTYVVFNCGSASVLI